MKQTIISLVIIILFSIVLLDKITPNAPTNHYLNNKVFKYSTKINELDSYVLVYNPKCDTYEDYTVPTAYVEGYEENDTIKIND